MTPSFGQLKQIRRHYTLIVFAAVIYDAVDAEDLCEAILAKSARVQNLGNEVAVLIKVSDGLLEVITTCWPVGHVVHKGTVT